MRKGVEKVQNQAAVKELYRQFMYELPGYWAVNDTLARVGCRAGVEWVSRNKCVSLPNENGTDGEWIIADKEQHTHWILKYL